MGRYVDDTGFVWDGAVYCCWECSFLKRRYNDMGDHRCTKYDKSDRDFQLQVQKETNCEGWRPGDR